MLEATGNTEVEAFYPIIFANYLADPEKMAKLIAFPSSGSGDGSGGGGGGDGAAAEVEVEKEEEVEEEAPIGGGDMFGAAEGSGEY